MSGDPITVGELRVILDRIPHEFNRCLITLIVIDDEARGTEDAPGIKMEGLYDYTIRPENRDGYLKLYAGGEALI